MSSAYVVAIQIVDREVMPREFRSDMLERDDVWRLVGKITCVKNDDPAQNGEDTFKISEEIVWKDGKMAKVEVEAARGVNPELSNEKIVEKWRVHTKDIIDDERKEKIEKACLRMEEMEDVTALRDLLAGITSNPIP